MVDRVTRSPHAAWVESPDRVVICLLDRLDSEPVVVSGGGAALWLALEGERSADDLALEMAELHAVDVADVAADVTAFVDAMLGCGALVAAASRPEPRPDA